MCVYNFELYKSISNFYAIFQSHTHKISKRKYEILIHTNKPLKPEKSQYAPNLFHQNPFSAVFAMPAKGNVILYLAFTPHSQSMSPNFTNSTLKIHLQFHHFFPLSSAAALVHATICPPYDGFYSLPTDAPAPQSSQNDPPLYLGVRLWHSFFPSPATNPPLISTE